MLPFKKKIKICKMCEKRINNKVFAIGKLDACSNCYYLYKILRKQSELLKPHQINWLLVLSKNNGKTCLDCKFYIPKKTRCLKHMITGLHSDSTAKSYPLTFCNHGCGYYEE